MIADVAQTFAVILIIAAAAGYLGVLLRRSWRQRGGGCCGSSCASGTSPTAGEPAADDRACQTATRFIPVDDLAARARQHRRERDTLSETPPA